MTPTLTGHLYSRRPRTQSGGAVTTIESWGCTNVLLPGYVIDMFHPTYEDARAAFRSMSEGAGGALHSWEIIPPEPGQTEGLTIDVAVFGDGPKSLILSSGLHGVEGFAGSAIQLDLIRRGLPADIRVVLIHAINPFGMAKIRRVNENNVDLNRNFLAHGEDYTGSSDGYKRLDHLLNPTTPAGGRDFMIVRTVMQILRHGYNTLKTAVVGGQYDFPKGLFFGGEQLEKAPRTLLAELPALLEGTEQIVHIDFHTGLGKSGTYALLVDTDAGSAQHIRFRENYGDRVQPWDADHGVAYKIRGGLPEAMVRLFGSKTDVITCEFGTLPALKVLKALRTENQATHWGGDTHSAKSGLLAAFRPTSEKWKSAIVDGGATVVNQAIAQLRA